MEAVRSEAGELQRCRLAGRGRQSGFGRLADEFRAIGVSDDETGVRRHDLEWHCGRDREIKAVAILTILWPLPVRAQVGHRRFDLDDEQRAIPPERDEIGASSRAQRHLRDGREAARAKVAARAPRHQERGLGLAPVDRCDGMGSVGRHGGEGYTRRQGVAKRQHRVGTSDCRAAGRLVLLAAGLLAAGPVRAEPPTSPTDAAAALADAFALIRSRPKIDLTHVFDARTPVWPGFGQARTTPAVNPRTLEPYTIARDGFRATYYAMVGQYGTHVDPPAHVAPSGRTLDEIPVDEMMLPLVVLDDTPFLAKDPAHAFSVADLSAWEAQHGRVSKGAFVALRTDMSKDWTRDPARFGRPAFPAWSLAVLKVLFEEREIAAIGHESLATDATPTMEGERYVLGHGHWQAVALDNLDKLPATGAFLVATWPKPDRGLGFPARVFAVLP